MHTNFSDGPYLKLNVILMLFNLVLILCKGAKNINADKPVIANIPTLNQKACGSIVAYNRLNGITRSQVLLQALYKSTPLIQIHIGIVQPSSYMLYLLSLSLMKIIHDIFDVLVTSLLKLFPFSCPIYEVVSLHFFLNQFNSPKSSP